MQKNHDKLDLEERVSYIASNTSFDKNKGEGFEEVKTPGELEDGAITSGGALNLFSREAFALFCQYGAIGIIYGMIPQLMYPLFNNYLNMEGYQTASYNVLVTTGWSFKVFWGMLSDCVPIFGYRRKSWMIIGWVITLICLAIMTFVPLGAPYCDARLTDCTRPITNFTKEEVAKYFNEDASNRGSLFIMLSLFVSIGYVIADCAADAMVVQYAQREPQAIRGRIQTAIYTVRTLTSILAQIVVAFFLNGPEYGGSFGWAVGPNVPYAICLVPCVLVIFSTIFLQVEPNTKKLSFGQWCAQFWGLLQKRVMWQICAYRFIANTFQAIGATPTTPVASKWARVEPLNDSLSGVIGNLIFSGVLIVVGKYGLNWNWRYTIAAGTLGVVVVDSFVTFMTVWNVVRNQWFYTGVALADNVPGGIRFIISTYCAVEIADVGNEGATYGLVTTINNLASPVASVIYKYVDSYFAVSQKDIARDDHHVRLEVTYCFLISYACKCCSLIWLFLLPPQKTQMQELKRRGGTSKFAGGLLIFLFFCAIAFSLTSNIMAIYPSTKCYRIAGGKGTVNGTCPK
ncbi:Folate-Biopterin Transporter (FBT) Family [Thraustotheca clavata]|uniref:Folate-Biopterin Transporter (FBT) Family n=1 Tax=Thraustotheca clavata TaxID=74557 RepID=A0A1V9ZYT8_9STRA|nr:Folate-Biopterin Transporter (FBT) Family [Thraustotheca clavata]